MAESTATMHSRPTLSMRWVADPSIADMTTQSRKNCRSNVTTRTRGLLIADGVTPSPSTSEFIFWILPILSETMDVKRGSVQ